MSVNYISTTDSLDNIWNKLPPELQECQWYESSKVRRVALAVFASLAVLGIATTLYAAFFFVAVPATVITLFYTSLAFTGVTTTAAIGLAILKPHENCPELRLRLRQEIGEKMRQGMSLTTIMQEYPRSIVTTADMNKLAVPSNLLKSIYR